MNPDNIVDKLKSIEGQYVWCEDEDLNETVVITAEGLYAKSSPYSDYVIGPYCISKRDYEALLSDSSNYIPVDNFLDADKADEMITAGCKPDINYFQWTPEMDLDNDFHERDEIVSMLEDMFVEYQDPLPWDEIAEDYLLLYYQVVKDAQNMSNDDKEK